jgi:hypothetical protein
MRQIQFDLKIDYGSYNQSINQIFEVLEKYNRNVNAHLLQINADQLTTVAQDAARKALSRSHFKIKGLTQEIVEGFNVKVNKRDKDTREIKVTHGYYSKFVKDIVKKTKLGRDHKFPRRWFYETVDTGRKTFRIVKKANESISHSPLKFYWKKMGKWVFFHWKGPNGKRKRFLTVKNTAGPVDYKSGAKFTEAAFKAVEAMVNDRISKMRSLI